MMGLRLLEMEPGALDEVKRNITRFGAIECC